MTESNRDRRREKISERRQEEEEQYQTAQRSSQAASLLPNSPIPVLITYAKRKGIGERLIIHFSTLLRQGLITLEEDVLSVETVKKIKAAATKGPLIVLLVMSADFLAKDIEARLGENIEELRHRELVCLIPIRAYPCDYAGTPYMPLEPIPVFSNPTIAEASNSDSACMDVAKSIRRIAENLRNRI